MEAYERQSVEEGLVWDGIKWVFRKLRNGFRSADRKVDTTKGEVSASPNGSQSVKNPTDGAKTAVSKPSNAQSVDKLKCSYADLPKDAVPADYRYWVKKYGMDGYKAFSNLCTRNKSTWHILSYGGEPIALCATEGKNILGSFPISREATAERIAACANELRKGLV